MIKGWTFLAYFLSITLALSLGLAGYWAFLDNRTPMYFTAPSYLVYDKIPYGTTELRIMREYCMTREVLAHIRRRINDGEVHLLPDSSNLTKKGCYKSVFVVELPLLKPGKYKYHSEWDYDLNPLQTITFVADDLAFEVVR